MSQSLPRQEGAYAQESLLSPAGDAAGVDERAARRGGVPIACEELLGQSRRPQPLPGELGEEIAMSPHKLVLETSRSDLLTPFGKALLKDRYLMPGEDFQDLFARVARTYGSNAAHTQRLYDYISRLWFMPATPILSNGGTNRGLPISCFLNEASDSLSGILNLWNENVWLAARGGGIGSYWGNLRGIGELVGGVGKTSGIIPFIHVMDSLTLAISQGSLRRGSAAVYLPIDHPEIEEFIELRRTTGGDPHRKALNLHHGIVVSDAFMHAVEDDAPWCLLSPKDSSVQKTLSARHLWIRILTARVETGEPYLLFKDTVNKARPVWHKMAGLEVKTSNLCSEITLPTGIDHLGAERTAVCCLSSVNVERFKEWEGEANFIPDIMRFLDNVLDDFIERAPESMQRAVYSAGRERSVGLGVMGWHAFLQANRIPFESVMAKVWNKRIFKHIQTGAASTSEQLGRERGACPDAEQFGFCERFSYKTSVAPTASIAIIANTSPAIEPAVANTYTHKTLSGSFIVRNKYLKVLLEEKGHDNEETWLTIAMDQGSVKNLDFLTQDEKDVFKTAFEIDQNWVIDLAADRADMVDQAQSLNIFLTSDVHKKTLHELHYRAWKKGVKSLYYCRSMSIQRAETSKASQKIVQEIPESPVDVKAGPNVDQTDDCLWCQ